jgi:hypothetical protein
LPTEVSYPLLSQEMTSSAPESRAATRI